MRKTPLIIISLLLFLNGIGQTYIPFPDDSAKWVWEEFHADKEYFSKHAYIYQLENDTVIHDNTYHNVGMTEIWSYICYDQFGGYVYCEDMPIVENADTYKGLTGGIREENKIIYYYQYAVSPRPLYNIPDTTEVLLYDFNISLGDTVQGMWDSSEVFRVVTDTMSVVLNDGLWRKSYQLQGGLYWAGGETWYEGMGSGNSLFGPYEPICEWCGLSLNCFWQGGEYIYGIDSCEFEIVSGTETIYHKEPVTVTPNPFYDQLLISNLPADGMFTVSICDIYGRICLKQKIEPGTTMLNAGNIEPGFYILSVELNKEITEIHQIIKL